MKRYSLISLLLVMFLVVGTSTANAYIVDLTGGRGASDTWNGAMFTEFTEAMQFTVSSGTGVIDPFLTIQKKNLEESFNSDYFQVLDATRPEWNHSIQISDLVEYTPGYYEFLLDINEPNGDKSLLTQHELEVYIVSSSIGGSISSYGDLTTNGTKIWDLDGPEDSQIEYDYALWNGSGQNIDASVAIPKSLFDPFDSDSYVYLYAQFGEMKDGKVKTGSKSEDGFEEYVVRTGQQPVPEPATMLLLGSGLFGLLGFRRKFRKN